MLPLLATLLILSSSTTVFSFDQTEYLLNFYRIEIRDNDKSYVDNVQSVTYALNETQMAVNASFEFKVDMGNEIEIICQPDKFVNNAYRQFPMKIDFNFCEGLQENTFGMGELYDKGKFPRCPMKKGSYYIAKWYPNASKFPPLLPNGKYRFTLDFMFRDKKIVVIVGYVEVFRPSARKRNRKKG